MIESWLMQLETLLARRNTDGVVQHLQVLVPEYRPDSRVIERERPASVSAAGAARR
jgi:hypothetical protein